MRQFFPVTLVVYVMCGSPAFAQQTDPEPPDPTPPSTQSSAPQPSKAESGGRLETAAKWIQTVFHRSKEKKGFYAELGGLPPGSGISVGPGYRRPVFDGRLVLDGSAAVSWSRGTFAQATVTLPRLIADHVSIGAQVKRQDFTRVSYFGIGPDSLESDDSEYRLENTDYLAFATVQPRTWLTLGGRVGYTPHVTIERPRAATEPATQDVFTEAAAPGLTDRPPFLHSDAYLVVDRRNHPSRPTAGGDYRLMLSTFSDRDLDRYSFRRIEGEVSQYIPLRHENWVIAVRARVAGTDTDAGNIVPFYLLPTLGGSSSLPGYNDYRFRDRNLLLLSAESRWRVFSAVDGAIFYDAGRVAPRFGDLDLTDLKTSYGVGLRFHANNTALFRVEVGRSREGTRFLVSITDALRPGHGSIFIPYVP